MGVTFGAVVIALLSFIAFRLYRNSQRNPQQLRRAEDAVPVPEDLEEKESNLGTPYEHELAAEELRREMHTVHNMHEMEAKPGVLRNGT